MKWTYEIITLFTELKLIKYISHSEMLKIFQFWHTHSNTSGMVVFLTSVICTCLMQLF